MNVSSCRCKSCLRDLDISSPCKTGWPWGMQEMTVCAICGNKRCPKASDHDNLCTDSNELGQIAIKGEDRVSVRIPVVSIKIAKVWVEEDLFGNSFVMAQHEGHDATLIATFHFSHMFTSSQRTNAWAVIFARTIGAIDPVEVTIRPVVFDESMKGIALSWEPGKFKLDIEGLQ